jgi:hypothetical protein
LIKIGALRGELRRLHVGVVIHSLTGHIAENQHARFSMKYMFLSAIVALTPISAMAESYDCTTTNFGRGGWVGEQMILAFDEKANVGSAYDSGINEVHKAPISVKFKKWSDNRYQFNWTVEGIKSSNAGGSIMSYKVTLRPQSGTFTLSGVLHGYDNVISGSGTCVLIK